MAGRVYQPLTLVGVSVPSFDFTTLLQKLVNDVTETESMFFSVCVLEVMSQHYCLHFAKNVVRVFVK